MPSDKLTFLEQLSNALAGQSATSGAKALGEGIGYGFSGGALSDIPDVMREAIEEHKQRTANQPKKTQDALEVVSGLAAMSNPYSAVGHAMDFVGAAPDMIQYKLSDAEPPIGTIAETGLKRRLMKGGAAADFAMKNQLERAKQNIVNRDIDYPLQQGSIEKFVPIQSTGAKWGPGEGKFQVIDDYDTRAYDLTKKGDKDVFMAPDRNVIEGKPHDLGIEFANTIGLAPEYRGKGYGKAIYQNMADVYGGGISHIGSTTPAARKVYDALGAIDTGIPSGGGTRQALPTRAMKADPEAMAAFEQKVKQYQFPRSPIEVEDTDLPGGEAYYARKPDTEYGEYGATPGEAVTNVRSSLPQSLYNRKLEPWNPEKVGPFKEQILGQISLRLDWQRKPEVMIGGNQAVNAYGNIQNFKDEMRSLGYDANFSEMSNMFVVKKRQP
jgi:GNAT superfamily N-acetyltransferase